MSLDMLSSRRLPIGIEVVDGVAHARVWAPDCTSVTVVHGQDSTTESPLLAEGNGYFANRVPELEVGKLYRLRLNGGESCPDPASRYQPDGPHGPSMMVESRDFVWNDSSWTGTQLRGEVIYELHVGTFTQEGSWSAAQAQLEYLKDLGIGIIEVMPLAEFPGEFNWGYDGVSLFAPTRCYGSPDDFRAFVDRAHALEMAVILDVVYNHVGPDGSYLTKFSDVYFSNRYETDWGKALNFDGADANPVREFYISNAVYWITEFHLDGMRLDATQQIFDSSPTNIMTELVDRCRTAAPNRKLLFVAENEPQESKLIRPVEDGGYGLDALWNDDFHHSASVALTGRNEAYYTDYLGKAGEFISCAKWGFLYQGQRCSWQKKRRGSASLDLPSESFVLFLENHDQIANSAKGARTHELVAPARLRATTALMFLLPATPMLFQGQEFNASSPFLYFADHNPELAPLVREGRLKFLSQFPSLTSPEAQALVAVPELVETFERCKLKHEERETNAPVVTFHRDLIRLRRKLFSDFGQSPLVFDGATLSEQALVLRYFNARHGDQLLVVNLGSDLHLNPCPEPLLAPPYGCRWENAWSTEEPVYGGSGTSELETEENWRIPGGSATFLRSFPVNGKSA